MKKFINNKTEGWTPEIEALFEEKVLNKPDRPEGEITRANFFQAQHKPNVGFTISVRKGEYSSPQVWQTIWNPETGKAVSG